MQLVRNAMQPILMAAEESFKGSADVYQLRDDAEIILYFGDKAAASVVMQSVADSPDYERFFFQHQTSVMETVPDEQHGSGFYIRMITASWANTAGDVIPIMLLPHDSNIDSEK